MATLEKKKELADWLMALENEDILNKIVDLKNKSTLDLENKFKNGLEIENFRSEIKERIKNYSSRK
ncbi:hypothetical protein [Gelidibacter gilvus]|uniref:Uncharacterized protein n=1 Tax=Gelidibacter gilvus TaxID=59602 RepID=A0A4Q0XPI8_9FLAO|nr:hypothetical protein [Gelidibacter gilvus]RXJ52873.1 hypothetical protein ESZ48_04065 [Gelidibacter gilvus]